MCLGKLRVSFTVKPPNKGHVGDNINSHALSKGCPLLGSSNCIATTGKVDRILVPKVFSTVESFILVSTLTLSWRFHCQRFHCVHK